MGISAPGADVGTRGGDPVDLRFYAGVSATYDNGLQPFAVDTKGNLVVAKGLYGEEIARRLRRSFVGARPAGAWTTWGFSGTTRAGTP